MFRIWGHCASWEGPKKSWTWCRDILVSLCPIHLVSSLSKMVKVHSLESLIRSKARIWLAWSGSTGCLIVYASWSSEKPSLTLSKPLSWLFQKLKIAWCRSTRVVALSNRLRKCFSVLLKLTLHQLRVPNFFSPWWMTPYISSNSRDKP